MQNEEVVKEVKRRVPTLDEALNEEEKKNARQSMKQDDDGSSLMVASPEESKVIVEDLGHRYNAPPGFILVFKDRTGKMSPYFTRNFYGLMLERKGYAHISVEKTGDKHNPKEHKYHYIGELIPVISDSALEALTLLKDAVDRETFYKEYRRLTEPIHEEGYASMDTVRMRTMKNDYNLERLARTRCYRHLCALYTGVGIPMSREVEEQADEIVESDAIKVNGEMADKVFGKGTEAE